MLLITLVGTWYRVEKGSFLLQVDFGWKNHTWKENRSHTSQPGNTLYISKVSSSADVCQLGKHLSPLAVCWRGSQQSHIPTPYCMVSVLYSAVSERWFKLRLGGTCVWGLNQAKFILCALLYIHNFHSWPKAWQPQIPNKAELSQSVAALPLPRQSTCDSGSEV